MSNKYRQTTYDKYDTDYANTVRVYFEDLQTDLKSAFQSFTDGLMDEPSISRHLLLSAISDFGERYFISTKSGQKFLETTWNYRPYQSF